MPVNVPKPNTNGPNLLGVAKGVITGDPMAIAGSMAPNAAIGRAANMYSTVNNLYSDLTSQPKDTSSSLRTPQLENLSLNPNIQAISQMGYGTDAIGRRIKSQIGG